MKILKLPFETTIKCECGCEFEFEFEDIKKEEMPNFNGVNRYTYTTIYVACPFCDKTHELNKISIK